MTISNNVSKNIFLISDTHLHHANIIKYCHRPYKTAEEMDTDIIQKWNSVVGPNDIVWHLGDFAFFKRTKEQCETNKELIRMLNGTIHLVLGNHDRHVDNRLLFWYNMGFGKVYDKPLLFMDNYILSHEPLLTKNKIDLTYHPKLKNIHGHVHNSNADYYLMTKEEQKKFDEEHPDFGHTPDITKHSFNVSIEVIDYRPIPFELVVEKMKNA